ncbi:MAG TPA: SGNH/GDSL hydrolase family protein, partial [Candidatus Saccharimonadia bacterium]|nr:SGNH/GDSL hydrolase family protein [Candidatus Saccharimonadia bacterium]
PPYFQGHFANGFMWIEDLATALGLQITPSLAGGTNFAFGGAKTGLDLHDLFQRDIGLVIPSLRTQAMAYRATLLDPILTDPTRLRPAPADALYVVWGGANDLREAVQQGTQGATPAQIASDAVGNIVDIIRTLQSLGAIYFLVPNLPDLGLTPQQVARGPEAMQWGTALSTAFNSALEGALQQLETAFPVQIARLNIAAHFQDVTANPQQFGVANVTAACLSGDPFAPGTVCANPESYIFWDAIGHPTAVAQALIADFALTALPSLVVTGGPHNPTDTLHVALPLQAQSVLQVRLGTTDGAVRLAHCTVSLLRNQGDATRVRTLKATLVQDANANGIVDAGEAVLGTQQVQGLVDTLTLDINPALELLPQTVTHLLVTLDINSPATAASAAPAAGLSGTRSASTWAGWSVALLAALGSIGMVGRRTPAPRCARTAMCLVLGWGLVLMSCTSSDHEDTSSLVLSVSMPVAGLSATGSKSGALTQPVATVSGATIEVAP